MYFRANDTRTATNTWGILIPRVAVSLVPQQIASSEIAVKMLKAGIDIATITLTTGLTEEEIIN